MRQSFLILYLCLIFSASALAEDIVVVANPKSGVSKLSKDDVIDIFMGRNRQLSPGISAVPLDLPSTSIERENFYLRLTGKNMSQITAYWARLHFTGRASPPALALSQENAIQRVIDDRGTLAYVSRSQIGSQVKIVFELNEK